MNEIDQMKEIDWGIAILLWRSKKRKWVLAVLGAFTALVVFHGLIPALLSFFAIAYKQCKDLKRDLLFCTNSYRGGRCGFIVDRRKNYCGGCGNRVPEALKLAEPPGIEPPDSHLNP